MIILLLEDNPNDAFLIQKALERTGQKHEVHWLENASEAIAYLEGRGQYAQRLQFPAPELIITDLKMPILDGLEFLQWAKTHPECRLPPVVMLSSSALDPDIRKAYQLGVNAFMTKPTSFTQLIELLRLTLQYWSRCERVSFPRKL